MKWFLCTRTREEDYFSSWLRSSSAAATTDYASVSDALEGADSDSRYCALVRRHINDPLTLSVSVSTDRKDAVGCPIRDFVCLEAESVKDEARLAEYFSLVLRTNDAETIYDANSPFASVFEELYETRSLDAFEQKFGSMAKSEGEVISNRIEFPRSDMTSRLQASKDVSVTVEKRDPFAVVLSARSSSKILSQLSLWGMPVLIFSEQIKEKAYCSDFPQSPFPFSRTGAKIAAVTAAAMIVWAIVQSCYGPSEPSEKIAEESQKTQSSTNLSQKAVKLCETNSAACLSNIVMIGKMKEGHHNVNTNDTRTIQR